MDLPLDEAGDIDRDAAVRPLPEGTLDETLLSPYTPLRVDPRDPPLDMANLMKEKFIHTYVRVYF